MIFAPITEITLPYALLVGALALFWLRRVWREAQNGRHPRLAWAGAFAIFFLLLAPSLELPSLLGLSIALLVLAEWWRPAYSPVFAAGSEQHEQLREQHDEQHWQPPVKWAWLSFAMGVFFIVQALAQVSWIDWNPQLIDLMLASGCLMVLVGLTNVLLGLVWSRVRSKKRLKRLKHFQKPKNFTRMGQLGQLTQTPNSVTNKTDNKASNHGKHYVVDKFVWRWQTNRPLQPALPEFSLAITHTGAKITNETQRPLALIGWSPDNINAMLMFSDQHGEYIDILHAGQVAYLSMDFNSDDSFGSNFGLTMTETAEQGIRIWYCHPPTKKEKQHYQDKGEDLPPPTLRLFKANWRPADHNQKRILN